MARWKNALNTSDEINRLKREAVIRESGRIFSRRGYHNSSLEDVAKSLKVSKGTLYNYVTDKEEILYECHKVAMDIAEQAFEVGAHEGADGASKLRSTLRNYIAVLHDELGACGVITEIDGLKPNHRKEIVQRRDEHERRFVALLEEGVADGSLRPVDAKLAVFTFLGAVNAIPRWYSPKGRLTNEQIADGVVDILLGGLANTGVSAANPAPGRRKSVTARAT
ncbi:TetR/AcrR family transcriptional regulator [Phenylobacterium sp.]|uniref:TetR/AcrR family transcriptional regulator n=1 Tax=Phenylobacterium sp. TaxID=1871053 RepID=UPI0035AD8CC7